MFYKAQSRPFDISGVMDHVTSDITDTTKAHAIKTLSAATTY